MEALVIRALVEKSVVTVPAVVEELLKYACPVEERLVVEALVA